MSSFQINEVLSKISKHETYLFCESKKVKKGILLRHDVDESLVFAENFFKKELEYGIRSTFFVMVSNPLYNPMSKQNRNILRKMIKHGFEIGLHFDPSIYKFNEYENHFYNEIKILENIIEKNIFSYSAHQPSVTGEFLKIKNYINAYQNNLFNDETYISDSCFSFRGKDLSKYIKKSENNLIQILLHPDHFITNGVKSYKIVHQKLISDFDIRVKEFYKENSLFKKHLNI